MKWSYSAHQSIRECQRKFAFGHIVASHSALNAPLRRKAHILNQLKHIPEWQGDVVHQVLAAEMPNLLAKQYPLDPAPLIEAARELANRHLVFSELGKYRDPSLTKTAAGDDYCALYEHEQGQVIPSNRLAEVDANFVICFENLATNTEFVDYLRSGQGHQYERWFAFKLYDVTIRVRFDLFFSRSLGQPTIVDWKVGQSETSDYSQQLMVYGLALARSGWWPGIRPEDIELFGVNLLENRIHQYRMDAERLRKTEDFIYRSVTEMRTLIGSGKYAELEFEEFDVANRPGTCTLCKFRSICIDNLLETAMEDPVVEEPELIQGRLF